MKQDGIFTNFTGGEFSPDVGGRVDLEKYNSGTFTMENFYTTPQGPAVKRGGTAFSAPCKYSGNSRYAYAIPALRLIPFVASSEVSYVLEFGPNYIRVHDQYRAIINSVPTAVASWATGVPYAVDDVVTHGGWDSPELTATYVCTDNHTGGALLEPGAGNRWFTVWSPLEQATIMNWNPDGRDYGIGTYVFYSGNVYVCIKKHKSASSMAPDTKPLLWFSKGALGSEDAKYLDIPTNLAYTNDLELDKTSVNPYGLQVTQSADVMFLAHKFVPPFSLSHYAAWEWVYDADLRNNMNSSPPEWTTNSYPSAVCIYEQRLVYAGSPRNPLTIWASKSGDFYEWALVSDVNLVDDADPWKYSIAALKTNNIQWLQAEQELVIGTTGALFRMSGATKESALTSTNISTVKVSSYGTRKISPIKIDKAMLFVQRGGAKIRGFAYEWSSDSYITEDVTLLSNHILGPGVKTMDYQNDPESYIWVVRWDGCLVGINYAPTYQTAGCFRYRLGGKNAKVVAVAAINTTGQNSYHDAVFVIVDRTISGVRQQYVEIIHPALSETDRQASSFYVDSGVKYQDKFTQGVEASMFGYFPFNGTLDDERGLHVSYEYYPRPPTYVTGVHGLAVQYNGVDSYIQYREPLFYPMLDLGGSIVFHFSATPKQIGHEESIMGFGQMRIRDGYAFIPYLTWVTPTTAILKLYLNRISRHHPDNWYIVNTGYEITADVNYCLHLVINRNLPPEFIRDSVEFYIDGYSVFFQELEGHFVFDYTGRDYERVSLGTIQYRFSYTQAFEAFPYGPPEGFGGMIDDLQLYNSPLTDAEVLEHWDTHKGVGPYRHEATLYGGLDHLDGETVQILADGYRVPDQIVDDGEIVIPEGATVVNVGLGYAAVLETVNLEGGSQQGTAQGKTKRIHHIGVRQHRSLAANLCYVRPPEPDISAPMREIICDPLLTGSTIMNQAVPLFSGDIRHAFDGGYDRLGRFRVVHTEPLPYKLIALMPEYRTR